MSLLPEPSPDRSPDQSVQEAAPPAGGERYRVHSQTSRYTSPWSLGERFRVLGWELAWALLCRWTPKPLNRWRLAWLAAFGATLHGRPFVHGRARVMRPWNLVLHDRACLGDGAVAYCYDRIEVGFGATIAQEAYLCAGSHDFNHPDMPLKTAPIVVEADVFVGLRAIVLPGVTVARGGVLGAGAVVSRSTEPLGIYVGNPARRIGTRAEHGG